MNTTEIVRENIRRILFSRHLTRKELCEMAGFPRTRMSEYMNTKDFPIDVLVKICTALDIELKDLIREGAFEAIPGETRDEYILSDDGARRICGAIVLQAVMDYLEAVMYGDGRLKADVEKFFRSSWGHAVADNKIINEYRKLEPKAIKFRELAEDSSEDGYETYNGQDDKGNFRCPLCGDNVFCHWLNASRPNRNGKRNRYWICKCGKCSTSYHVPKGEF